MTEQFRKKNVLEYILNFISLSKKNSKVEILKAYTVYQITLSFLL